MAPWLAAIVQAMFFAVFGTALWVVDEGWGVLAERGTMFLGMGIVVGLLRVQTGSLWAPIGFHLAFQVVAQTVLSERMSTSDESGLMVAAFVSSFVLATMVTAFLCRRQVTWSRPEPDPSESYG